MSIVTIISILAIVASIFFAIYLSRRPKVVPKEQTVRYLRAAVNYKISFMTTIDGIDYTAINVSITNNKETKMDKVGIRSQPFTQLIGQLNVKKPVKLRYADLTEMKYTSLDTDAIIVPAGGIISGYLLYKSVDGMCPVDELKITANGMEVTVVVNKDLIKAETVAARQFDLDASGFLKREVA